MAKTAKRLEVRARYIHHPEFRFCPHCGGPLRAQPYYRWRKTIQCLHGAVHVASQARECGNPRCEHQGQPYTSAAAQMVAVPECTYGLDIIAQIGWWRDQERMSRAQIRLRLRQRGVQISERQVDYLYARYQALLGCAQRLEAERLQDVVRERGGLIIGLDGLERRGASEQLWVVREVQAELVLAVDWLPRVSREALSALLEPVAGLGLLVLAVVSARRESVIQALKEAWPVAPHYCSQSPYGRISRSGRAGLYGQPKRLPAAADRCVG
jgi:hypothetical protein